jgi:fumarate hydratase class I
MVQIRQNDLIESVADALQYISYYHPVDYITNLARAYELEQNPAAKDAMAQILINSRMCAEGHRPICQDTGIVTTFLKIGLEVQFTDAAAGPATMSLQEMVDEGVRRAWLNPDNKLRGSILRDPAFSRKNTIDNTPSVVEVSLVKGATVDVTVAAKGGGSEAKSKFVMLNPSDSVIDWVVKTDGVRQECWGSGLAGRRRRRCCWRSNR